MRGNGQDWGKTRFREGFGEVGGRVGTKMRSSKERKGGFTRVGGKEDRRLQEDSRERGCKNMIKRRERSAGNSRRREVSRGDRGKKREKFRKGEGVRG